MFQLEVRIIHRHFGARFQLTDIQLRQLLGESLRRLAQRHPVLRTLRPGQRRFHGSEVQLQRVREYGVGIVLVAPHALQPGVGFHQRNRLLITAGDIEVIDRLRIDGENATGGAIFRRHVGNRRAVGQRHMLQTLAIELHEFAHHAFGAQHLRHRQHQIGGGGAFLLAARQLEADHFRNQHRHGLTQHGCLRLDPAHAPAQHAQAVHHGGVRIRADQRIGIGHRLAILILRPHHLGQVFQVHLVADAGARRHHAEIVERFLAPAQELIALHVALHLQRHVLAEGLGVAIRIHHHRVVDHQVDRGEGVDPLRVGTEGSYRVAHGGQVDHRGDAGEILHQHAGRAVGDVARFVLGVEPAGEGLDVIGLHAAVIFKAQQVLEQDFQREGQPCEIDPELLGGGRNGIGRIGLAADFQRGLGIEAVLRGH